MANGFTRASRRKFIRRKRRQNTRRKRYYRRNRSSKAQANQLAQLSKKVTNLNRKMLTKRNYFNYYNEGRLSLPSTIGTSLAGYGYSIFRLHPHTTQWDQCLDAPTDPQKQDDTWNLHRGRSHIRINIGTEATNPIEFHVYIVSVKRKYRDLTYANYGTDLQGFYNPAITGTVPTPDAIGFYPFNAFSSGQVFVSRIFEVKKRWSFTLGQVAYGNQSPAIRNMRDTVRNLYWSEKYGGKTGSKMTRGSGQPIEDALDAASRVVPRKDWTFCLIITNNGFNDLELAEVQYTNLFTLSTDD